MVAFLRAINVGGHVVTMEELRRHFVKAGARNVETFIASGNVIFDWPSTDAKDAETRIEERLQKALGYEVKTFVRSTADVAAIAQYEPFPAPDMKAATVISVGFLGAPLDRPTTKALKGLKSDLDDFHTFGREIYWLCRTRTSESPFFKAPLEKRLSIRATFRNMNTIQRLVKKYAWTALIVIMLLAGVMAPIRAAAPSHVDITWMSISNIYYDFGTTHVLTDGYITRVPQTAFFGGGGGLAQTRQTFTPDVEAVTRVLTALGGPSSINVLLTGHSHFDHSFDTATWSKLTGARIYGSKTTCLQAQAEKLPANRCMAVDGGEKVALAEGVTMRVVRWNHSGDPATNPEQHNPVELEKVPAPDPQTGGLHAGVAEDFPNGGGNRGFLFVVDGPDGRFSWFFQNSASAVDLHVPIVVGGRNFGAPIDNLKAALKDAGLESVDLWIGSGGAQVAALVLPVLKPKAFLPVHWDGLWRPFKDGVPGPYADPAVQALLTRAGVELISPAQYMDKWRLDHSGIRRVDNAIVKRALGFER